MKERSIIFNAPMVRAILKNRKTQTRRIIAPQPHAGVRSSPFYASGLEDGHGRELKAKYGKPGDRLWVREKWADLRGMGFGNDPRTDKGFVVAYGADTTPGSESDEVRKSYGVKWKPSIHLPRWASRINLEITSLRIERLQNISEEDAKAEGLVGITKDGKLVKYGIPDRDGLPGTDDYGWPWTDWEADPRLAFRRLWDSIHGGPLRYGKKLGRDWKSNPWVWVIGFRRA